MSRTPPLFYVFHGDDDYTIRAEVEKMRQKMDDNLNTEEFDGTKARVMDILSAARSLPFLGDKRLIIVHGMLGYLSKRGAGKNAKDELKRLVEGLKDLPEFSRIIFVEMQSLSAKNAVIKLVNEDPTGFAKDFSTPRNPVQWIKKQAESYGVKIDPPAIQALITTLTHDKKINLQQADNELVKMAAYVGEGGTITVDTLELLTSYVAETSIFDMVDALARRDGKTAIRIAHQMLDDSKNNDVFALYGMIIRQFRLLIQAKAVLDNRNPASDLSDLIGVHSFVAKKLANQVRQFESIEELEAIHRNLLETDVAIKTGRVTPELSLDLFINSISR